MANFGQDQSGSREWNNGGLFLVSGPLQAYLRPWAQLRDFQPLGWSQSLLAMSFRAICVK